MSELPKFWEEILHRLGLQSFSGIENISNVLTFLGYTTTQSISKLRKQKELNLFQIEVAKLSTNSHFCTKHPELKNWQLLPGTIEILKDISDAASCASYDGDDLESVQKTVFESCMKVAPNLILSNVLVNFNGKVSCEIICPSCKFLTKLSAIKQVNTFAPPKFNTYNFVRHINTQHVNKKRKSDEEEKTLPKISSYSTVYSTMDCDISPKRQENVSSFQQRFIQSSSTPLGQKSSTDLSQIMTPKTSTIFVLKNKLTEANNKIKVLENSVPTTSASTSLSSLSSTPKSARIEKLSDDLLVAEKTAGKFREENWSLRHKFMDLFGNIRTVCRIKPDTTSDCFDWTCSNEGTNTNIQIGK